MSDAARMPEPAASVAVTHHLTRLTAGDPAAAGDLLPLVYDELRAIAGHYFRRERPNHTLQPTALVHEAFLKLVDQTQVNWQSRAHFLSVAATAIHRLLIDHARKHNAQKRAAPGRLTIHAELDAAPQSHVDLLALHEALERLAELNTRQARVVELRYFTGMSVEEVAEVLEVSANTVKGDWRLARAWLQRELESVGPS